jgi:hypothetical protein
MAGVAILTEEQLEALMERVARKILAESRSADVLSTTQAARLAERDEKTVRAWCETGALKAKKRGRVWAIVRADLDAYLAGGRERGVPVKDLVSSAISRR